MSLYNSYDYTVSITRCLNQIQPVYRLSLPKPISTYEITRDNEKITEFQTNTNISPHMHTKIPIHYEEAHKKQAIRRRFFFSCVVNEFLQNKYQIATADNAIYMHEFEEFCSNKRSKKNKGKTTNDSTGFMKINVNNYRIQFN